jgi:hypothetical protein
MFLLHSLGHGEFFNTAMVMAVFGANVRQRLASEMLGRYRCLMGLWERRKKRWPVTG